MKRSLAPLTAAVILTWAQAALAQEVLGFAELRGAWQTGVTGKSWQLVERVRPSFSTELAERLKLAATVEAGFAQGRDPFEELEGLLRASDAWPSFEAAGFSRPAYGNRTLRINSSDDYLDVDRLHLDVYGNRFDLRVGRQALNWGSAQFFNPTDPFPEVLLAEPWRPRQGVNAVRLHVALADLHDLTAVIATNDLFTELRAAARLRLHYAETDFALIGAWRGDSKNVLVGLDLRGTLGVGWWVEAAYLFGPNRHEELAVGIDYSFPVLERATVFLQYYRNGAGASDPTGYPPFQLAGNRIDAGEGASGRERDPFAPFTLGRDYGLLGTTLLILPELSGVLAILQNFNDGTGMLIPTVSYAALDWLDVALSAQLPYALWGQGGEFRPNPDRLRLTVPGGVGGAPVSVDLAGLVPSATLTLWTRASF